MISDFIHAPVLPENHLDSSVENYDLFVDGYSYRKDRNIYEEGVALYIQDHIPTAEFIWVEIHPAHVKPALKAAVPGLRVHTYSRICEFFNVKSD